MVTHINVSCFVAIQKLWKKQQTKTTNKNKNKKQTNKNKPKKKKKTATKTKNCHCLWVLRDFGAKLIFSKSKPTNHASILMEDNFLKE